jgi:predicted NAD/FAD-binding protein
MKIAVVGSGIAGLSSALWLSRRHEVTVFEAGDHLGGHTHTVRVDLPDETHDVDTGFIVYNDTNYPLFSSLLGQLGVATQPSEMSFSVSGARGDVEYRRDVEYRGNGLGLWARPASALDPSHSRLLADILQFNRDARRFLAAGAVTGIPPSTTETLADFLSRGRYGPRLAPHYLVPLGSAIWSADPTTFDAVPVGMLFRFLENHGMLQLKGRPRWRTVTGGAARYVEAIVDRTPARFRRATPVEKLTRTAAGVTVMSAAGPEDFDAAVVAVHSDQALGLLSDPSPDERRVLGAIGYRPNVAVLHTDASLLPRRRRAWASWNAHLPVEPVDRPTVTYWMNRLQRLDSRHQICVTLNREQHVDPATVLGRWVYHHPVFDAAAVAAQARRRDVQGHRRTWYCGAYWGYGFHEDGVASAVDVCRDLGVDPVSDLGAPIR